ncbi:MAG: hypothetical protein Q8L84_12795, partial [Hyphomonas sp.]|nr:hypothetical protein [Hyphomonas sp.]
MITGDHLYADPRLVTVRNRFDRLSTRRIDEAHEAEEDQPFPKHQRPERFGCGVEAPLRQRQNPHPLTGDFVALALPEYGIDRLCGPIGGALEGSHLDNLFGCALDADQRRALFPPMQRRHVACGGIEGNFGDARRLRLCLRTVGSQLAGERDQRALHRVAFDLPVAV